MHKNAKKSGNYLHLCKIFRNFVAEIRNTLGDLTPRAEPRSNGNGIGNVKLRSKHHEYETDLYDADCRSGKCNLCDDAGAECNGATGAEYYD